MPDSFTNLVKIMERLRGDNGCPWDKEQTPESLKPFLIEEAYEVLEALDEKDSAKLKEELGDLLYQILFHAQIAKEKGEFDINDILDTSIEKMTRRHPHVFGDKKAKDSKEVLVHWEETKKKEREKEKGNRKRRSILESVPKELPALLRAHQLQSRAARVGFDWKRIDQVFNKVEEEITEFKEAYRHVNAEGKKERERMEDELGDIFFSLVNVARFLEVNPEDALRSAIRRFTSRFSYIEEAALAEGRSISSLSIDEMERLWQAAKMAEDKGKS